MSEEEIKPEIIFLDNIKVEEEDVVDLEERNSSNSEFAGDVTMSTIMPRRKRKKPDETVVSGQIEMPEVTKTTRGRRKKTEVIVKTEDSVIPESAAKSRRTRKQVDEVKMSQEIKPESTVRSTRSRKQLAEVASEKQIKLESAVTSERSRKKLDVQVHEDQKPESAVKSRRLKKQLDVASSKEKDKSEGTDSSKVKVEQEQEENTNVREEETPKEEKKKFRGGSFCAVSVCTNCYSKTRNCNVSYYNFPRDAATRKIWIARCRKPKDWNFKYGRICSVHFEDDQFEDDIRARIMNIKRPKKLKEGALPTWHLEGNHTAKNMSDLKSSYRTTLDLSLVEKEVMEETDSYLPVVEPALTIMEHSYAQSLETNDNNSSDASHLENKTASTQTDGPEIKDVDMKECYTCRKLRIVSVLLENQSLKDEMEVVKESLAKKKSLIDKHREKFKTLQEEVLTLRAQLKSREMALAQKGEELNRMELALESLFSQSQMDLLLKKKKRVSWGVEDMKRSFALRFLSKKAYLFVRNEMKIPLPFLSSLDRWASYISANRGKQMPQMLESECENDIDTTYHVEEMDLESVVEISTEKEQVIEATNEETGEVYNIIFED